MQRNIRIKSLSTPYKKILRVARSLPGLRYIKNRVINTAKVGDIKSSLCEALGGSVSGIRAEAVNVEHHRAHLGSAFLVTRFEEAVCVSVDGFGDFLSAMWGIGKENKIDIRGWVEFPHSLGVFYTALTQFLGFDKYGDEYKVMGTFRLRRARLSGRNEEAGKAQA